MAGISYFADIRRRDENVVKSGTLFRSGNLSTDRRQWDDLATFEHSDEPWEVYHLEKGGEIRGRIRGCNTGTTVGRFRRSQVGLSKHPAEGRRVEREDAGVDAEERAPTQNFHVSVFEVEGLMLSYRREVDGELVVRGV